MLDNWLDQLLDDVAPSSDHGRLPFGHYRIHGPGILELTPNQTLPDARACVLSAAVHGNETAPVELVGELLARLEAGLVRLGAPVLILIGNPPALRAGERFITTNLNRLFKRNLTASGEEPDRARTLMAAVDDFFARHATLPALHFDLHTAIRDSRYTRFAVEPFTEQVTTESSQWQWLSRAGIQAVLHQHCHSWTFSHYSRHYHGTQAFTLELGRVAPFGDNELGALRPMRALLEALTEGHEPPGAPANAMHFFRVEHELMRQSEDFVLCFDEATPNFNEFCPGECLARDAKAGDYVVGEHPQRVVFPNAKVEIGARAALLVVEVAPPA
ncbi:succinylglutamate desuccinylase [Onishia taeanensis]|uniref:Succinylglutamate desuccinylase n=1 Tax=Onishia taeanensis TaxID=284577 RepID=A0A1G7TFB4_9GAMM|nr:succinylglutamate desuccinylase [Halomonas taeanensis]SDG33782.1 succinylglutamate desuccinylase [Halomonas taeanensis]